MRFTNLFIFDNVNDSGAGELTADSHGNFYFTTVGTGDNDYFGTVYELASGTHSLTAVATFDGTNGWFPASAILADASGNLYGTTYSYDGDGTVFKIAAGTHTLTTLLTYSGMRLDSDLVIDAKGNLYGTTRYGTSGVDTVFEISPVPEPSTLALLLLATTGLPFVVCTRTR